MLFKNYLNFFTALLSVLYFSAGAYSQLQLSTNSSTDYVIVISSKANKSDQKAASKLAHYLNEITGAEFPVVSDSVPETVYEICLGQNSRIMKADLASDTTAIQDQGFLIEVQNNKLYILGKGEKATLYGIYDFLEDDLGCRYYTPDFKYIPKQNTLMVNPGRRIENPVITFRNLFFPVTFKTDFCEWHKIHSQSEKNKTWGSWVHTFKKLLPADDYFKKHPEYFSEINASRISNGQLCLSNPEVLDIVSSNLKKQIKKKPDPLYWSVSQNDNYKVCKCDKCLELDSLYGGPSGTMIWFVNQVAEKFPDKVISTLAYQYTRTAPENIVPADNVNIMLCTIECNRSQPIATDPTSRSFRQDLENWVKLTDDIMIWDYTVQFSNYISPFPNLFVLQPNIQYFSSNGADKMFQQGSSKDASEFVELRSYLITKLLWDPNADVDLLIDDFLNAYYGEAARYLKDYIYKMHKALEKSGDKLSIYGVPFSAFDSFLKPKNIKKYNSLFDKAEEAVKDDPLRTKRVKIARLPLNFAILDISVNGPDKDFSYFEKVGNSWQLRNDRQQQLNDFVNTANEAEIKRLRERGTKPVEYKEWVEGYLSRCYVDNLALLKPVVSISGMSKKYNKAGKAALTDGMVGLTDYKYNWLGFQGNDMEAVIDLGKERLITQIETRFLQIQRAWIFFPEYVEYQVSTDGEHYELFRRIYNSASARKDGVLINIFKYNHEGIPGRYVKVVAKSLKTCPDWHTGAGKPSWIFVDEVIVN